MIGPIIAYTEVNPATDSVKQKNRGLFMKFLNIAGLVFASTLGLAVSVQASVVYDNGVPNGTGGNDATQWVQAEDFTLGGNTNIAGGGIYIAGLDDISNWGGTLDYWIFTDSAGSPDTTLASGAGQNIATSDTGDAWGSGGNAYLVEFDLEAIFNALDGVTYWLGVHLSTDFDRDDIYWVNTASNSTSTGEESNGGSFDNWSTNLAEHAFYLNGERVGSETQVPVPASLALLGVGLLGLAATRRRRHP